MNDRKEPTPPPVGAVKPPPPAAPPKPPLTITEDQLSILIANTSHLVLYKLRKEMHREIDKEVARLWIDHEKRWEQALKQVAELVRVETVL